MALIPAPPLGLSQVGRAAHDVGLASASASGDQQRAKRRLNALGAASMAAEVGLVGVNAALNQYNFRRPPVRRLVPRFGRV